METMRGVAVLEAGKAAFVDDIPMPVPGDYECLVKVHTCGYCNGTDTQIIKGAITEAEGMMPFPTILGHEGVGEIITVGKKVRYLHVGEHYLRPDTPKWYGRYSCTYGTMAEYALAADRRAMIEDGVPADQMPDEGKCERIPEDIPYEDAAVMLSLLECISAVHNFGIEPDMSVLIFGAGPMGLGVANYLRIRGTKQIVLVDGIRERLDYARERFGIEETVDISTEKLSARYPLHSFDIVMDIVGLTSVLMEGTDYLKQGGKLCSMGVLSVNDSTLNVAKLQNNTCLHMLNFPYQRMDYLGELVELVHGGKLRLKDFYSHVLPANRIRDCAEMIRSKSALKIVLSFDEAVD